MGLASTMSEPTDLLDSYMYSHMHLHVHTHLFKVIKGLFKTNPKTLLCFFQDLRIYYFFMK